MVVIKESFSGGNSDFWYLLNQKWAFLHLRKDGFYFVTPRWPFGGLVLPFFNNKGDN